MIGRIYRLDGGGKFYIGSTTCDLKYRLKKHRSKSNENIAKNRQIYLHFKEVGWNNVTVSIIEEFEVNSRRDLLTKECEYIKNYLDDNTCLNKIRSIITPEEKKERDRKYGKIRREKNPEYERNRLKEWRKNNPEKWKEQYTRYNQKKHQILIEKDILCHS